MNLFTVRVYLFTRSMAITIDCIVGNTLVYHSNPHLLASGFWLMCSDRLLNGQWCRSSTPNTIANPFRWLFRGILLHFHASYYSFVTYTTIHVWKKNMIRFIEGSTWSLKHIHSLELNVSDAMLSLVIMRLIRKSIYFKANISLYSTIPVSFQRKLISTHISFSISCALCKSG